MSATDQEPRRRLSAAWFVPLAVLVVVSWIVIDAWNATGVQVDVHFEDGYGLALGDRVRSRGIEVGRVRAIHLAEQGVAVRLELDSDAAETLARVGARWWISRPQVDWSRVSGLESLVGPRLVMVDAPTLDESVRTAVQVEFVGMSEAPFIERREVGDLTVQLQANLRGSLQPGAAVFYRGVKIGTIVAATLADDAMTVDVSALIKARYAPLVRVNSRFYQTGALELELGLTGLRARLDSLETLLLGGVTLVTPTEYGEPCKPGAEFNVTAKAKDEWLLWRPQIELN